MFKNFVIVNMLWLGLGTVKVSAEVTETIRCDSGRGQHAQCTALGKLATVVIEEQHSSEACDDANWGFSANYIWVKNGCSATFKVYYYNTEGLRYSTGRRCGQVTGKLVVLPKTSKGVELTCPKDCRVESTGHYQRYMNNCAWNMYRGDLSAATLSCYNESPNVTHAISHAFVNCVYRDN